MLLFFVPDFQRFIKHEKLGKDEEESKEEKQEYDKKREKKT